jgi:hypothetical protein
MKVITVICFLLFSGAVSAQENNSPKIIEEKNGKITNYRVEGNLASKNDIGCINIINANNKLTPPDLYKGVADCINAENYENASELFALAGMYGSFDAARISDKTAGQAKTVLIMNTFNGLPEGKKQKFSSVLTDRLSKNKIALRNLCSNIIRIGYPTYYPDYMILHGIKAFTGNPNKGALSETFNPTLTWNKLFETFLHCPPGSALETSQK